HRRGARDGGTSAGGAHHGAASRRGAHTHAASRTARTGATSGCRQPARQLVGAAGEPFQSGKRRGADREAPLAGLQRLRADIRGNEPSVRGAAGRAGRGQPPARCAGTSAEAERLRGALQARGKLKPRRSLAAKVDGNLPEDAKASRQGRPSHEATVCTKLPLQESRPRGERMNDRAHAPAWARSLRCFASQSASVEVPMLEHGNHQIPAYPAIPIVIRETCLSPQLRATPLQDRWFGLLHIASGRTIRSAILHATYSRSSPLLNFS